MCFNAMCWRYMCACFRLYDGRCWSLLLLAFFAFRALAPFAVKRVGLIAFVSSRGVCLLAFVSSLGLFAFQVCWHFAVVVFHHAHHVSCVSGPASVQP